MRIGKEGLTNAVEEAAREAFNTRELLKVRVLAGDTRELGHKLADRLEDVHVVQVIGGIVVLYRRDPEHPEIKLP